MRTLRLLLLLAATLPSASYAQDIVVMRRAIAPPSPKSPTGGAPAVPTWVYGPWETAAPTSCGVNQETRTATCMSKGQSAPEAQCGAREPIARTREDVTGCAYRWTTGEYGPLNQCSAQAVRTRTVACQWVRYDGTVTPPSEDGCLALAPRPVSAETVSDSSGCTGEWTVVWSDTNGCINGKKPQVAAITCQKDGAAVDQFQCSHVAKPESTREVACGGTNILRNGEFAANGGGWSGSGFTYAADPRAGASSNSVGRLESSNSSSPAYVSQQVSVVAKRSYTLTFKAFIPGGSFCSVPFVASISAGGTILAKTEATLCSPWAGSLTWVSNRTGTVNVGFEALAQSSNKTMPIIDDVKLVDNNE